MKYYTDKGRDGQDKQEKTCRKTQHVKMEIERDVPKKICRMAAVGENYNLTRDNRKKKNNILESLLSRGDFT